MFQADVPARRRAMRRIAAQAAQITADFSPASYNMKQVFAETAVYCMGH